MHTDDGGFMHQVLNALGSRSFSVARAFTDELLALADGQTPERRAIVLNTGLAVINSYEPKNEGQAMLAAQMVAVHMAVMRAGAVSMKHSGVSEPHAKLLFRGARAFAEQSEVMARLQGRTGKQQIDVHYHDHRRIVEGDVHVHRGGAENGGQAHAPNSAESAAGVQKFERADLSEVGEHQERAALRGQDPKRRALPGPSREGASPLSAAWLWARIGRPARGR